MMRDTCIAKEKKKLEMRAIKAAVTFYIFYPVAETSIHNFITLPENRFVLDYI